MKRWERAAQARRELDRKFVAADLTPIRARPRSGWIRAIRGGLGMSQDALAKRLGISGAAVAKLERSELDGATSIGKLADVARALDCTLVYAIVPNTNLEDTVRRRARLLAEETLGYVTQTMELEAQALDADLHADQLAAEAQRVIHGNRLWSGSGSAPE